MVHSQTPVSTATKTQFHITKMKSTLTLKIFLSQGCEVRREACLWYSCFETNDHIFPKERNLKVMQE